MQYNLAYRKLIPKSVDPQYFSREYLMGLTAQKWVEYAASLNRSKSTVVGVADNSNRVSPQNFFKNSIFTKPLSDSEWPFILHQRIAEDLGFPVFVNVNHPAVDVAVEPPLLPDRACVKGRE